MPDLRGPIPDQMRLANAFADGLLMKEEWAGLTITMAQVADAVCEHYEIGLRDLKSARRSRCIAEPRQMFYLLAHELTPKSLPQIGRWCGGRDHTTVMHGIKKAKERLRADAKFAELYRRCVYDLGRMSPQ